MAATSRDPRPAVLFGAGASASAPASLPTAWGLIRAYCERLEKALRAVPDLSARIPPLEDWIRGLRFEQIVSTFNRMGLALDAIAPLDSSRTPNENHRLLASLYCAGWPLLTTNFDVLTEIAILEGGGDLHQIVDRDERDGSEPSLHKLHGSFWRWRSGSWLPSADSICTTFEDVGEQYSRYMTNDVQRMRLVELIREQPLIVVGYSAGDDFDISPIVLDTPRDQPLIWIQHAVDEPESTWVTATSLEEVPAGARHLVPSNLFRAGHRHSVTWIFCDTTAYLRTLVMERASIAPQRATAEPVKPIETVCEGV